MKAGKPRLRMSLRSRVLLAIALVLTLNAGLGAGLFALRAQAALKAELQAALQGAGRSLGGALDPRREAVPQAELARLIANFDGDRHLRAELIGPDGRRRLASTPQAAASPAPGWFSALVDPGLAPFALPLRGGGRVLLRPAPQADLAADWLNFGDLMVVLCLTCLLGCGLVFLMIGQALRPLDELVASFRLIGSGHYQIRVAEGGASEIASIGRAFNLMAGQLLGMQGRNRMLEEQLLKLQDEERADLARDLHDDIGPYLFAVGVDAAMIGQLAASGRPQEIAAPVKAIQTSVAHMQARVRDILGRLRPTRVVELGLEPAIRDLVDFWRSRRPEIAFETSFAAVEERLSDDVREAAYRVVQEGLSNAVRHGRPGRIAVALELEAERALLVRVSDDGTGEGAKPAGAAGFGLLGMQERVAQAGGALEIQQGPAGWTVSARLPAAPRKRTRRARAAA